MSPLNVFIVIMMASTVRGQSDAPTTSDPTPLPTTTPTTSPIESTTFPPSTSTPTPSPTPSPTEAPTCTAWTHPLAMRITGGFTENGTYPVGSAVTITWDYDCSYGNIGISFWIYYGDDWVDFVGGSSGNDANLHDGSFIYNIPTYFRTHRYFLVARSGSTVRGITPFDSNYNTNFGAGPTFTISNPDNCTSHDDCGNSGFGNTYCDRNFKCSYCDECLRWYDAYDFNCPSRCGSVPTFNVGDTIPDTAEADAVGAIEDYITPDCPGWSRFVQIDSPLLLYADTTTTSYPRTMTVRLRDRLVLLAETMDGDNRFNGIKIKVYEAYKTPPTDPVDASLHNEGRAAEIGLEIVDSQQATEADLATLIGSLGRLARFAGLEWIHFVNASRLYVSVLPDQCSGPVDLVLLVDGSGSINLPRYGGDVINFDERILEFARQLLPMFNWGTTDRHSRMAMATFSSSVTINFNLNDHFDNASLLSAINQINYPYGGTYMSLGIEAVREQMLTEGNGMRPIELGIPRVVIAITDGVATPGYEPGPSAQLLRDAPTNANVFAMGVGSGYSYSQLQDMASTPYETFVHTVKTFDRISAAVDQITTTACRAPTIITPGNDGVIALEPCEFTYFQSGCGTLSESVIEITVVTGMVNAYVDNSTQPGPFNYQYKDETTNTLKVITVFRAPGDNSPLYVAVKGVGQTTSTFQIRIYSNIFTTGTTSQVSLAENTPVSVVVYTPSTIVVGATYGIVEGNDDNAFSIDTNSGEIVLARELDFETTTNYLLKIQGVSNAVPCQNGVAFINITITNVNDNVPSIGNLPGTASVEIFANIGTQVFQVEATDADGMGSLSYTLASGRRRAAGTPFAIDENGSITSDTSLMAHVGDHTLSITVSDGSLTQSANLVITVNPCPACPPGMIESTPCATGIPNVCITAPTNDPTLPPTDEPTNVPTNIPSTFPTQMPIVSLSPVVAQLTGAPSSKEKPTYSPTFGKGFEGAAANAEGEEDLIWWPALLILLLLLLLLLFLIFRKRNKKEDPEAANTNQAFNPMYHDMLKGTDPSKAALFAPFLAGEEPIYALAKQNNDFYDIFRKCVAFDHMYYGNQPLALNDDALADVYDVLNEKMPVRATIRPLRELTKRFLDTEIITKSPSENVLFDIAKFIDGAIVDDLIERAIDGLTTFHNSVVQAEAIYDLGGSSTTSDKSVEILQKCLDMLRKEYVPEANKFLTPVSSNTILRQLPRVNTQATYDLGTAADAKYNEATFNTDDHEYAASSAVDDMYTMASSGNADSNDSYALATETPSDSGNIYMMAAQQSGLDAVYDIGSSSSDAVYDLGSNGAPEVLYDRGAAKHRPASLILEPMYDVGCATSSTDDILERPIYDAAAEAPIIPVIYDTAADDDIDKAVEVAMASQATYEIAAPADDEYIDSPADIPAKYEQASNNMYTEDDSSGAKYFEASTEIVPEIYVPMPESTERSDSRRSRSNSYAGALDETEADDEDPAADAGYINTNE